MNNRSKNVKKNIIYSFLLKFFSIGLSFVLLPLTVHYLTEVEYGIWVTLFTVMNWVNFLDMGLGLGLRNKLAEAVSKNNLNEIRLYLSTGIFSMIGMGSILLVIFFIGINMVNMQSIFNTREISEQDLYISTLFTGIFVILAFILSVINQIYYAYQRAAITGAIQIVHNLIMLGVVYYLTLQSEHKLFYFVLSFGIAILLSRLIFIFDFFYKNRNILPKFKYVKLNFLRNICNLGIKFFIIQLTCIVMFSSSNILITQCLGPEYVRSYDVVFKIFSIITMLHSLILSPLWSAYTDAYIKKDFFWMKKSLKKMIYIMIPIIIISLLLVWKIEFIISFWLGDNLIIIPKILTICVSLLVIINCWTNIWATFVNGIGKIDIQLYGNLFSTITIIPLAWFFMTQIGAAGMALAISIEWLLTGIPLLIQVKLFFKNKN